MISCQLADFPLISRLLCGGKNFAHVLKLSAAWQQPLVSLSLWQDAVPYNWDRSESLEVYSWSLPGLSSHAERNMRFPIVVCPGHFATKDTHMAILKILAWSLTSLAEGIWPTQGPEGVGSIGWGFHSAFMKPPDPQKRPPATTYWPGQPAEVCQWETDFLPLLVLTRRGVGLGPFGCFHDAARACCKASTLVSLQASRCAPDAVKVTLQCLPTPKK